MTAKNVTRGLSEINRPPISTVGTNAQCLTQISPEQHQFLVGWNDTKTDYPKNQCIQQLFEEQVKKFPDAIALVSNDQQLTYRELNARANQLAHYLHKLDVRPDALVGICMERSMEMIVGVLGILKAGGAYVPLNPSYPGERLAFILEDTHAAIVLTDTRSSRSLPPNNARVICVESDWKEIAKEPQHNPETRSAANDLAYVIYTSGSTGVPKGVEICHRGVVRLLFGVDYVRLDRLQTFLHLAPISFDAATFELWGALLHGGKCVLFPGKVPSAKELGDVIKKNHVTILWLTAALFNNVINEDPQTLSEVRQLLIGGEALSVAHVKKGLAELPNTEIINGYGPTESTTFTCCYSIQRQLDDNLTSIPIGKPIGNTQVYILGAQLNPVFLGTGGELYIGGDGLARGYLNRPELTEEKFIHNPFSTDPASRLYKTGDLARYLPDGNIEFLGRVDNQVKIHGYRIELGEVESVLLQHGAVRESVVIANAGYSSEQSRCDNRASTIEDSQSERRLVAYVVVNDPLPSVTDLRSFLKTKLPAYMIPSAFVFLDALPLTLNGKVDRKALPVPDHTRPELEESYQTPRTPVEELLAEIWAEVLRVEKTGIHDKFFDLGGDSLLATRVVSRILRVMQVEVPLRAFFESPTVAGLAERIEEIREKEQGLRISPLLPVLRDKDLPLSFAQQRLWFLDQLEPGSSVYNILSAIQLAGTLNVSALEQSLQEIVNRHEALRTTFSTVDAVAVQVIAPSLKLTLPVINLSETAEAQREEEARRLAKEEGRRPFDLTRGPLFHLCLLRLAHENHILLLTLHHIVSDGWSMEVLYRELSVLYEAFSDGKSSPLTDLPIQYADFAVYQRQWLRGEVLDNQLSYWREQLADVATLQLPTDRPRPAMQTYRGKTQSVELSETLTHGIKTLSHKNNVTLFMTLLAAFQCLLHRYTGQNDIAVGSPIANRTRHEIESSIGFFVNTVVMRSDLSGDPTFPELLRRVRDVALGAYAHQDLPFEKLVEELQPERDLSRTPFFQVFFNMLGFESVDFHLKALEVRRLVTGDAESKFDLTVYVSEKNGKIALALNYNADLFESGTICCMLDHYHNLLYGIVQDPDSQISRYSLLTKDERYRFSNLNNIKRPTNPFVEFKKQDIEQSICSRFEQQAKLFSTKLAIKTQAHQWSYAELNRQANRIAHTLLKYCGHGGERVALLFDHGAPMVAAILGVLKSGNAYVPLDPAHPQERLDYISGNCQTAIIVTDKKNVAQARSFAHKTIAVIDVNEMNGAAPTDDPDVDVSPDALAYILYTSGSTGQPKGVMQNHRNVLHHMRCYTNNLHIVSDDKMTLLSSYGFDAAVMDIFGAVLNGATLCPLDVKAGDSSALRKWIVEEAVTIYHSTPTVYRYLFAGASGKENLSTLRLVVLGGEEVRKTDVDLFKRHCSEECIMVNGLGPTESTLALQYFITHKTQLVGHLVPVGYPVEDTEVVLLNETGVDAEVYGEIGIRSDHVALGYWQRPELSEATFLTDPQGGPQRLYRTGDMGRLLPDGSIGFCGRRDFQAKIRGFRIELGEIEAALDQHPAVRESVVIVREDSAGDKQLVAYVAADIPVPAVSNLRAYVKTKLPDYMVPSAFVVLERLPLTRNGKVDRNALPPPARDTERLDHAFFGPRNAVEKVIADVWSEVLGISQIGRHDNFFDLGGHSLKAVQIVSRLRKVFQSEIPLHFLFEFPTIATLATEISGSEDKLTTHSIDVLLSEIESMSDDETQGLAAKDIGSKIGD